MRQGLEFEWDERKNIVNIKKHDVAFEEAKTVFGDEFARISVDEKHSISERRFYIIGQSQEDRIILVCYTERESRIRIISSRRASKKERTKYEEYKQKAIRERRSP